MTAKPILLVGNSINQCSKAKSWDQVLYDLQKAAKSPDSKRGDYKPYPIYFEELSWRARSAGVKEGDFLAAIAKPFIQLPPTLLHKRIMGLNVRHILTTNYDYSLEASIAKPPSKVNLTERWNISESKFSLFRRNKVGTKWVWHIHGEALIPSSIMLGHDHYVNYAGQLREYWNRSLSYALQKKVTRAIKRDCEHFEQKQNPYSWLDLFVRDPIHICGLTFDFAETVLWYALMRRRILADNSVKGTPTKCPPDSFKMSNVTYHYFMKEVPSPAMDARIEVFRSMGVRCLPYHVHDKKYEPAWEKLLAFLEKEIGAQP